MIQRQIQKGIYQYSNAELIDFIKNSKLSEKRISAKCELEKRKLSQDQFDKALKDYDKFIMYKSRRKKLSLEFGELLAFFFIPFWKSTGMYDSEDFTESEAERFRKYGFDKKYKQVRKVRLLGMLFYVIVLTILITY